MSVAYGYGHSCWCLLFCADDKKHTPAWNGWTVILPLTKFYGVMSLDGRANKQNCPLSDFRASREFSFQSVIFFECAV